MNFKKLALAAAVAVAPMSALALEPMQDEALSGVTGQDGISISLTLDASLDVGIEDTDGTPAIGTTVAANTGSGMILIDNMGLTTDDPNTTGITEGIDIALDSASSASGGGVLQVGIEMPYVHLDTGNIYIGQGTDGSDAAAGIAKVGSELTAITSVTTNEPLLDSVGITLTGVGLDIQLGSEATNFLALSTTSAVDISIGALNNASDSFVLRDQSNADGAGIVVDQVLVQNVDLDGLTGSITDNGLALETNAGLSGMNVAMMGVALGDTATAPALGNVYVTGLDLSNTTITISGH